MANDLDFTGEKKSFIAGFCRGFRMWMVRDGSVRLRSTAFQQYVWNGGVNVADCQAKLSAQVRANDTTMPCDCECCTGRIDEIRADRAKTLAAFETHKAPSTDENLCRKCGFYAYHMPKYLTAHSSLMPGLPAGHYIFGSIKATGHIVLGTRGFRAEYVEVEALYGSGTIGPIVAEQYGVPWFENQDRLVEEFPFTPLEGHTYEPPGPAETLPMGTTAARAKALYGNWTWAPLPKIGPRPGARGDQ